MLIKAIDKNRFVNYMYYVFYGVAFSDEIEVELFALNLNALPFNEILFSEIMKWK
jgi:hypothetical protein